PVLDAPVSPDCRGEAFHVPRQTADKLTHLFRLLALPVDGFTADTHDTLGIRPLAADNLRGGHGGVGALVRSAVLFFGRRQFRARHLRVATPHVEVDGILQVLLIAFDGEHVVGSLLTHLLSNRFLATHGVDRHGGPTHIQQLQQHGNGRDLVGMVRGRHLPKHHSALSCPGTYQVQGLFSRCAFTGPPQRLAVDRYRLAFQRTQHRLHKLPQHPSQLLRVQQGKHPTKRVVRRNPALQLKELLEPLLFGQAEQLNIYPTFASRYETAQGYDQNIREFVPFAPINSRIGYVFQTSQGVLGNDQRHDSPP